MSAPRRPGDDRRAGSRTASPRATGKTGGAEAGARKKAKPGAIRSFHRAAALREKAAKEGLTANPNVGMETSATPKPARGKPAKAERPASDRSAKGAARVDRPQRTRDAAAGHPANAATKRPARATAKPSPVRAAGPSADGGADRASRRSADGAPAPASRTPRPVRPDKPERAAGAKRPDKRPEREKPGVRVRKDGSIATRRGAGRIAPPPAPVHSRHEPQRIAKLLARAGVASRRDIERMIEEGRVALNGTVLDTPATILTTLQGVTVDGEAVQVAGATRLFLFHKPTGFLTAERDPRGRPTIYDRLPEGLPRVMPIGRLDLNTEGLLLLTNDGEFKRKLELPSTGIPRIYRARAYGEISQEQLETLIDGVTIDGIRYGSIDANMERRTGRNVWIEIKITEGKNREVRRVLEYMGLQVSRLIRVAYGQFVLADLEAGGVVEVRQNDLVEFRKTLR